MLSWLRTIPLSPQLERAIALVASAVVVGTAGYMAIGGMGFLDALYQTVTTLSTVGFREVEPFGTEEKIFTIFLVFFGVGAVLYTLTLMVKETLEGDIRSRFYQRRMQMEINRLEDHYILCGFGRVGQEIARELQERGLPFVVIEKTPEEMERAKAFGYLVIEGDATEERVLVMAGLPQARALLAASDTDAGNTYITLTARNISPSVFIVARAASPHNEEKLRLAGADRVLSLYSLGGRRMVLLALQPLAADFMDTLATGRHGDLVLAELPVTGTSGLSGMTCGQLTAGAPAASLLGVRQVDGTIIVGPRDSCVLHDGDIVIVLAEEPEIAALSSGLRAEQAMSEPGA